VYSCRLKGILERYPVKLVRTPFGRNVGVGVGDVGVVLHFWILNTVKLPHPALEGAERPCNVMGQAQWWLGLHSQSRLLNTKHERAPTLLAALSLGFPEHLSNSIGPICETEWATRKSDGGTMLENSAGGTQQTTSKRTNSR
jgi:hypothetical protein